MSSTPFMLFSFRTWDYFHRVLLISSIVWSCSITGKPNLTYAEALESEKQARKVLKSFPHAIKAPFLLIASHTKRCSLNAQLDDVLGFIKDRYFKGEELDAVDPNKNIYRSVTILEVLSNSNKTSPVKTEKNKYRVQSEDGCKPKEWIVCAENLKRDRFSTTRDKCKLFLKQHVEQVNGVLKIKEASIKKFVTEEGITADHIFLGKPPDFEQSKRLKNAEEKKQRQELEKKNEFPKLQQKQRKKKKDNECGTKNGKQQSISKYLKKSEDSSNNASESKGNKKDDANLKEEMERMRKEKAEKDALEKKRLEEQKAILAEQVTIAIKKYNRIQEDLELSDQRVIPAPQPVCTIIGKEHFSDFMFVLEFMTSFAELLSIKDKFANGLTMELLERALILKEVNGPLSDVLQVLLSTIFSLQIEEENEVPVRYDPKADCGNRKNGMETLKKATEAAIWCESQYCTKLNELPMDSTTISELLRLHFLASGALIEEKGAKWRYSMRGGYQSYDDPGLQLAQIHNHILLALNSYTVFHLSIADIFKILKCLIEQIMTYSSVRELIEERVENARIAKQQYVTVNAAKKKREASNASKKWDMKNEIKKKIAAFEGSLEEKAALRKELEEKMAQSIIKMDGEAERDIKILQRDIDKCKESFFDYQIYLGSDRAHRSYWLFESLPGLFVEHDHTFSGKCLDVPTPHIPGLALCPPDQRKKFITQTILNNKLSQNDKENRAVVGELVIEKLMLNGSAKLKGLNDYNKSTAMNGIDDESASVKKEPPSVAELMMCTANPKACPVHNDNYPGSIHWGFYHTEEQLNELIESLNSRGLREKNLRENLENEKELILTHIKDCPIEKIIATSDQRDEVMAKNKIMCSKIYDAPNFNHESGTDANVIFEASLRENLLELESKITIGYLGSMKVNNRDEWREAIEQFEYKQLSEPLVWGLNRVKATNEKKEDEEMDEGMEDGDSDDDQSIIHCKNPAYNLHNNVVPESKNLADKTIPLDEPILLREKVHSLAKALLQIEQCIDCKFFRFPFGPEKQTKDKATMAKKLIEGQKNLAHWEETLMRATSFSQIFLYYNVLYDAIQWSRSAERIACMICRRKGDPDMTLLCDDCNRACHMYCLKPKLKQVPEGDWFCPKCRPEEYAKKKQTKKRKVFVEDEPIEDDPEEDEVLEETIVKEVEECSDEEGQIINNGSKKRNIKRKASEDGAENSDDEPLICMARPKRHSSGKRFISNGYNVDDHNDDTLSPHSKSYRSVCTPNSIDADLDSSSSRRARRTGDDLPLNNVALYTLLDDILKHPDSWPFNRPVSVKEVPDYYSIIKNPMDFAKIKSKLNMGKYRINEQMMNDVQLIFRNCDLYNTDETEIYQVGRSLERYVLQRTKDLSLPFKPSDMLKTELLKNGRRSNKK
ncbi:bromodomain adjacent to zinc finger domain protein 1A isoform X2 [Wyeomyia smithii]|uniref:bromodomain adjacent to zinc finger domain protein 1A isoform X2 n=1 Tax=Wyeomyia smithii TaxID=174621 RepID=UPI002467FB5A|nr:bromodomain adjacent to zinc finger domain protein 1A isoform X2 [Wyeomyia smithii]